MVAVPASEMPQDKRKGDSTMTAEEARDLARKKRAEIEKAMVNTNDEASSGWNGLTEALDSTTLKVAEHGTDEQEEPETLIGFGSYILWHSLRWGLNLRFITQILAHFAACAA